MGEPEKPQFSDIDAWGVTHTGKVRQDNQDHFFVGALARGVTIDRTSLESESRAILHLERLASLAVVADGVGGQPGGEEAARIATRTLIFEVSRFFHAAEVEEDRDPEVFSRLLHEAALAAHESLLVRAERDGTSRRIATTLTLFLGLWPHAYILQVGDSRCYMYLDGSLTALTRDQTLAEELVASGTLTRTVAEKTRWTNVLSSAIGGEQATPVVTRIQRDWGAVLLLCSDGLTKHVSDEKIEERLANMVSSRQVAEQLLQDALDDGGTDNISIVVGRTLPPDE